MPTQRSTVAAALALLVLWLGAPAAAQEAAGAAQGEEAAADDTAETEDTARARALFTEGVEFANARRFEEAASRFRAAYDIRPAPAVAYNLAAALVETGELLEASELLRRAVNDETTPDNVRAMARGLLDQISRRFGRVNVTVSGNVGDATVSLGDHPLGANEFGIPIPVNPGSVTVTATRGEQLLETQNATVEAGTIAEVNLDATAWPPVVPDITADPEPVGAADEGPKVWETWWFWTAVGVLVVTGVVLGIVIGTSGTEDPLPGNSNPAVITFP